MLSALARTLRLPMQPPAPVRLMAKRAAQAPKPRDSAKVANLFKRGARGLFGGKMIQFGNIISFSNKKWPHPPPATTHAPAVVAGELPARPPRPRPQVAADMEAQRAEQALLERDVQPLPPLSRGRVRHQADQEAEA